ncbi:MAG: response regulator [Spirochaetales bacterium]|nr:response regulator [Spirochaetales bacterium]
MKRKQYGTVLLVEDNPDHLELTLDAFKEAGCGCTIKVAENGTTACDYLWRKNQYHNPHTSPRPEVIFLDTRLRGLDGFELVRRLHEDRDLNTIPVILLSTSGMPVEIEKIRECGAEDFIVKPLEAETVTKKMRNLGLY